MKNSERNLTQAHIEKATCTSENYIILWDAKQEGLGVKVTPTGYKAYVYRSFIDGQDKRKVISSCTKITLEQARKVANEHAYQISKGQNPFDKPNTKPLYNICTEYMELRKFGKGVEKRFSQNTYNGWKRIVDKYIKPNSIDKKTNKISPNPIGNKCITKITIGDATKLMEELEHAPVLANRLRSLLSLAFKYSIKKGYREIGTNVWDYVDKYEENPQRTRLNEEQNQPALFLGYMQKAERGDIKDKRKACIDPAWIYMIWVYYFTGARPSEIITMRISEVDFEKGITRKGNTKTGEKEILLSHEAICFLRLAIQKIPRLKGNNYIFAGPGGKGHRQTWNGKQWDNLQQATGITATPYALRRYFTTMGVRIQIEEGGDKKIVTEIMSHSDEAMTDLYAGEDKVVAAQRKKLLKSEQEKIANRLRGNLTIENS